MRKKYLIKFIIVTILGYPILFLAIWLFDISNMSFSELAKQWYGVLIADIFASALYCFVEYKQKIKRQND